MFSLIIGIIAIALVVALGGATLFYGGDALTDNSVKTKAAKFQNEADQIIGAITYYRADNDGYLPSDFHLDDLTPNYLTSIPEGDWHVDTNKVVRTGIEEGVCLIANDTAGFTDFDPSDPDVTPYSEDPSRGIPNCDMPSLDPGVPCCLTP